MSLQLPRRFSSAGIPLQSGGQFATQVFADTNLFQAKLPEPGTKPATANRSWLKLQLRGLYGDRKRVARTSVGSNLVNPAYMLDLLRGALTGSVEKVGVEPVRATRATHFKLNISPEKAFENAPKARQEVMIACLSMMGVTSDIVSSDVWLDDDGLPVRIKVRLKQVIDRRDVIQLNVTLDLFDFGTPVDIALPKDDDTAEVDSVAALGPSIAGVQLFPSDPSSFLTGFMPRAAQNGAVAQVAP
jgi:hypothetical protein